MNASTIYDRTLYKDKFKEIYNSEKYNFPLNDNILSNIINKWKNESNKFNKSTIFNNKFDYKNNLILREYRTKIGLKKNSTTILENEFIIWANEENIKRIRKAKYFYIDGTFPHPPEFKQLLIIMYKDIITNLKIPGIYILLNGKNKDLYDLAFDSIIKILTEDRAIEIEVENLITDTEKALVDTVKKYFPNSQRIGCFFHYKKDIMRNIKAYGLYKKHDKSTSDIIIQKLSSLPFIYKGDIKKIKNFINNIIEEYPNYTNFLNNYFMVNKFTFFEDQSLNYFRIPKDCRTNNYLENYNGYIKKELGKNRVINWVNFIHFIKMESQRSVEKLINTQNFNISIDYIDTNFEKNEDNNQTKNNTKKFIEKQTNIDRPTIDDKFININENIDDNKLFLDKIILSKIGFINIGASCFINSALQILLHCKIFMKYFLEKKDLIKQKLNSIGIELLEISNEFIKNFEKKKAYIDISNFNLHFGLKHDNFGGNKQNDSQEFLRLLLEDLSHEFNENKIIYEYKSLSNDYTDDKIFIRNDFRKDLNEKENSFIKDLFYIEFITTYTCECGKSIFSFQNLIDIPLLFPPNIQEIELNRLLDDYFSIEKIEFKYSCINCHKIVEHEKKLKISKIPQILILSLQRLDYHNKEKNDCLVRFDEFIDISKYIDTDCEPDKNFKYKLFAIINHKGEFESGHYYSLIKLNNQEKWYEFNDSNIYKMDDNFYNFDHAYVLFYTKSN